MTPRLLTTQETAERLGLTPGSLHELRWKDDGLPIFQNGLSGYYRQQDLEVFEQPELRSRLRCVVGKAGDTSVVVQPYVPQPRLEGADLSRCQDQSVPNSKLHQGTSSSRLFVGSFGSASTIAPP